MADTTILGVDIQLPATAGEALVAVSQLLRAWEHHHPGSVPFIAEIDKSRVGVISMTFREPNEKDREMQKLIAEMAA
jgi:hypothetical protein